MGGFDLWQVKGFTIFDNVILTDDVAEADAFAKKWKDLSEVEQSKRRRKMMPKRLQATRRPKLMTTTMMMTRRRRSLRRCEWRVCPACPCIAKRTVHLRKMAS